MEQELIVASLESELEPVVAVLDTEHQECDLDTIVVESVAIFDLELPLEHQE